MAVSRSGAEAVCPGVRKAATQEAGQRIKKIAVLSAAEIARSAAGHVVRIEPRTAFLEAAGWIPLGMG
jgi:hypothetical protein